mmetsp:Transcript_7767/g.8581  ORF Transcript_7767/g.8581 Transcript_7767/m.8581 type:complete len:423 (-) Transcript_7767:34-1302(-)|eukprot:CAMPEP_0194155964 /NCGR_PEP_ID=MMETSP0152-20130528/66611_1 /TAXON_ID=1049557 /ORGANISM="Thalassiothrix antarctica, Strain L6-D1" /LENGTH=422 /DNA_ID=CAMNT_0038863287 /DNA_START=82 /DNA_END=1350 /DNA_ORIENTATION=+
MTFRFGGLLSVSLLLLFCNYSVPTFAISTSISPEIIAPTVAATTHFRLQFDGSLRPPRNIKYPTISHRTAICAACIGMVRTYTNTKNICDQSNDGEMVVTPLAVGAMELPVSMETTLHHAEYGGLLMGLEWLIDFIIRKGENEKNMLRLTLTIEGDCRTVIDQLNGKSIPRKLETLHRQSESLLDQLSNMIILNTEIRHIPRAQNSISDSLCYNLNNVISTESWLSIIHRLEEAENQMEQQSTPSQVSESSLSLSEIFETATERTKHYLRPPLYEMIAKLAVKVEDYELLISIGEQLIEEASSTNAKSRNKKKTGGIVTSLKRTGVIYQIQGWEGLGKEKKVRFLERKHLRILFTDAENDTSVGSQSIHKLKSLCNFTEGKWDASIPNVWKPMLDKWFVSARCKQPNEAAEDKLSPVWVENS